MNETARALIAELMSLRTTNERHCSYCGDLAPVGSMFVFCRSFTSAPNFEESTRDVISDLIAGGIMSDIGVVCNNHAGIASTTCSVCGIRFFFDGINSMCCACEEETRKGSCAICGKKLSDEEQGNKYRYGHPAKVGLICGQCVDTYTKKKSVFRCGKCGIYGNVDHVRKSNTVCYTKKRKRAYVSTQYACNACCPKTNVKQCYVCRRQFNVEQLKLFESSLLSREASLLGFNGCFVCPVCEVTAHLECSVCESPMISIREVCDACRNGGRHILNYHYEPVFQFEGDPPFYGLEIETTGYSGKQTRDEASRRIEFGIGKRGTEIYQKKDASIGTWGIEFCFHPKSVDVWFGKPGTGLLRNFREVVSSCGGHSYKTGLCGIHIHRSNYDLVDSEGSMMGRIRWLACLVALEPYLLVLAQRTGANCTLDERNGLYAVGDYGSFSYIKAVFGEHGISDMSTVNWYKHVKKNLRTIDRHGAATIETGMPTVEYKFFRGTTNVDTLLAYIALAHYIAAWSIQVNIHELRKENSVGAWKMLLKFLGEHKSEKPAKHLIQYARARRVM